MKRLTHKEIRKMWFDFFESKGHKIYPSAPLIPINDDSLLWVNAGVTPLKKFFDGTVVPNEKRITSIQKCIRTNDIENVGITKRHQTFFEMMGNFSIGDYFKNEAIEYSFELLTSPEWFDIDKNLLYVTIYTNDDDAYNKWIEVGLPEDHIIRLDGNFWEIGEGPCGPDSEIFFDRGEKYDPNGDALRNFQYDKDQERFVEIWNNVFSQFNSKEGVSRINYEELPNKNIDTGAGLERWCCIFQDVDSNFDTDLFVPIINHIEELSGIKYEGQKEFKIIADHIRAITFAICDGAAFENVGRGYVLRRLLRRSVRAGRFINLYEPFMYKLVSDVIDIMGEAYPELIQRRPFIETTVIDEEKLFLKTLDAGERRLKQVMKNSKDNTISGEEAFRLYDTYGFPFELTLEYLEDYGFTTDKREFDKYMDKQRELARNNSRTKTSMASQKKVLLDFKQDSTFCYGLYRVKSNVIAIFSKDNLEHELTHDGYIALDKTCFYAESGGQVSDTGMIVGNNFKARVVDVFKGPNGQHIHKVRLLDGIITVGDACEAILDEDRRKKTEANHSSVHILQLALQTIVDSSIKQAGSYVDGERLRFDFNYTGKISDEELINVEEFVNNYIKEDIIVSTEVMPIEKAKELGAMALFNEKYGNMVRVVKIGKSIELCGGTHTSNTSKIEKFAICNFESKGSNVYRIEAVTGDKIDNTLFEIIKPYNDEMMKLLLKVKNTVTKAKEEGISIDFDVDIDNSKPTSYKDIIFNKNELSYVKDEVKNFEKKYNELKEKKVIDDLDNYRQGIREKDGIKYLIMETKNMEVNTIKTIADNLINELDKGFIFISNINGESINFIARSNSNINAGYIIKQVSMAAGGNGGGSPTFASGGGKELNKLNEIYEYVEKEIKVEE